MTTKPYIAVLRIYRYSDTVELEFTSGNEAQQFRENNIPDWRARTSITLDYDRRRARDAAARGESPQPFSWTPVEYSKA